MTKLKSTVKVGLHPIRDGFKIPDNGFVFSSDVRDWQRSNKKAYRECKANKTK